jgi:hypothetical protein
VRSIKSAALPREDIEQIERAALGLVRRAPMGRDRADELAVARHERRALHRANADPFHHVEIRGPVQALGGQHILHDHTLAGRHREPARRAAVVARHDVQNLAASGPNSWCARRRRAPVCGSRTCMLRNPNA